MLLPNWAWLDATLNWLSIPLTIFAFLAGALATAVCFALIPLIARIGTTGPVADAKATAE